MNAQEYYRAILPSLRESFDRSDRVTGYGRELIQLMGFGPYDLPVTVQAVDQLEKLTAEWGLEVFLPVMGRDAILFPFDFEISLRNENHFLYAGPMGQAHFLTKYIFPVARYLERFFIERKIPFMIDYTPSGGHLLLYVLRGSEAWREAAAVGWLEEDLKTAYAWTDPDGGDMKRLKPTTEEEGRVFSGLGRLAEYLGLKIVRDAASFIEYGGPDDLEVHLCDAEDRAVNIDISWTSDPLYYRIMRAPAALHKKNMNYYHLTVYGPMADTKALYYDGITERRASDDPHEILAAQWNLERAAEFNRRIPGHVPYADATLAALLREYAASPLCAVHRRTDATPDLPRGEARRRALGDAKLHEKTHSTLRHPNPRMLQPEALKKMVGNFLECGWESRAIANVIRDCYIDPIFGWTVNWLKCPAETRANMWTRIYADVYRLEKGERLV
jgi:hypothetical protein